MKHGINLDQLGERGRISQAEAQSMHAYLHHGRGNTDSDSIIADWNSRSPESPWDRDGDSSYIRHLTGFVVEFMKEHIGWQSCDEVMPPERTLVATKIDDDLGVRALHDLVWHEGGWWNGGEPIRGWVPTHWKHRKEL